MRPDKVPVALASLLDRVQQTLDLSGPLWGVSETLGAIGPQLPPVRHTAQLVAEATTLGRRALLTDTIALGLLPVEEAAETEAPLAYAHHQLYLAVTEYGAAHRLNSAGQHAPCRAALAACLRALFLAVTHSGKADELQERALHAYALGELRAQAPGEEVADAEPRPAARPPRPRRGLHLGSCAPQARGGLPARRRHAPGRGPRRGGPRRRRGVLRYAAAPLATCPAFAVSVAKITIQVKPPQPPATEPLRWSSISGSFLRSPGAP